MESGKFAHMLSMGTMPSNLTVAEACNGTLVTPLCLRTLYGTIDYTPQAVDRNKMALNNYLDESSNRSDVQIFLQQFRPDAIAGAADFKVVLINGGEDEQTPETTEELNVGKDQEGNLDAETLLGIAYPTPMITYNTGGMPPFVPDASFSTNSNEPYQDWLNFVLNQTDLPQVISSSYGDDEQTVPLSYATKVCQGFAQLGARGVSIFIAAGDQGVGPNRHCVLNDGSNSFAFLPEFPSSCPFVTSVGATTGFDPEVGANDPRVEFTSGAGFSNYFAAPAYQAGVVQAYVAGLDGQFDGFYNKSGRA